MSSQSLFEFDKSYGKIIIGTDEAGRGPGAGGGQGGPQQLSDPRRLHHYLCGSDQPGPDQPRSL